MSKQRKTRKKTIAQSVDKYDLYQQSVQEPTCEVEFFDEVFRAEFGRPPMQLREDFCGTSAVCCEWVKSHADRKALGVDLDPEPIAWCKQNNFKPLSEEEQSRITFLLEDVRHVIEPKADVISAQNFSYFIFMTRDELREYFKAALANLTDEGLFVLDMMGGSGVHEEGHADVTKKEGFKYIWEQTRFDPITHFCKFHINFKFSDGSKLKKAFTYEWRLWSLPEITELLGEAGFRLADVYWEGTDEDGEGDGIFKKAKHADADPSWIAYVVGVK